MKYERLTSGEFDGQCDHWTSLAFMGGEIGCWNEAEERYMLCKECIHKQRYDRLKDLEDKIENGTLVELPFAIGQKIYSVIAKPRFEKEQYINEIEVGAYSVEKDRIDIIHYIEDDGIHRVYWTYQPENAFLTKAEAEKRLEELRGENK